MYPEQKRKVNCNKKKVQTRLEGVAHLKHKTMEKVKRTKR